MKLYLVSGAHHDVPNILSSAHLTPASADAAALDMVNMIRDASPRDGMDSDEQTPNLARLPAGADWRAGLKEAQRCIASFNLKIPLQGPDRITDDRLSLIRSQANVEIVELEIADVPALPAVLEDYLKVGDDATEALMKPWAYHESAHHARGTALRGSLQMMRLAAIWQSPPTLLGMTAADIANAVKGGTMMFESPPCRTWSSPGRPDKRFSDQLTPPPELTPVHVVIGCHGGVVQWSYADRGGVKLTTIDFDVEADDHRGFDLTLIEADDGTAAPATVGTEDVELNPDYVERLLEPVPCNGEGHVYGDDDEDQVEDPAKWLVTAEIGILGPDGGTTSYSGFFPDTDSMPQLLAMASATIRRRFEPAAIRFFKMTTVPPFLAKGEGG